MGHFFPDSTKWGHYSHHVARLLLIMNLFLKHLQKFSKVFKLPYYIFLQAHHVQEYVNFAVYTLSRSQKMGTLCHHSARVLLIRIPVFKL